MSSKAEVSYVITLRDGTEETVSGDRISARLRELIEDGNVQLDSPVITTEANGKRVSRILAESLQWRKADGARINGTGIPAAVRSGDLHRDEILSGPLGALPVREILRTIQESRRDDAAAELSRIACGFADQSSEEEIDGDPSAGESGDDEFPDDSRWLELEARLQSLEDTIVETTGDLQSCLESVQTQTADGTSTLSRRIGRSMLIALLGSVLVAAVAVGSYLLIPTVRAEEGGNPQPSVPAVPDLREDLQKVQAGVADVRAEHRQNRELINRLLNMRLSEIIQDAAAKNSARNEELIAPLAGRLDALQKSIGKLPAVDDIADLDAQLKALTDDEGELTQMQSAMATLASQKSVSQLAADLKQLSEAAGQLSERQQTLDDQIGLIADSLKIPAANGLANVIVLFDAGEAMGELEYKPARDALVRAVSESIRHTGERSLGVLWNRGSQRPIQLVNFAPHTADEARPHADRIRGEVISSGADHQWSIGLSDALERISTAPPAQSRRIVYITTPPERPEENVELRLRQIIADARQVKAEVWIVQLTGAETPPQTDLWQLAARTGGQFLLLNASAGSPGKLQSRVAATLHQALSLPVPRGE